MSDETQLWFEFETLPTADDAHASPAHNTSPLHGGIPTDPVVARQDVPQLRPTWPAAAGGQLAYTPGPQISDPAAWAGYAPSTTNTHNANSSNTRLMTIGRSWPQRLPKKLNRVGWQGRLSRQRIGKPRRRACAPSITPTLSFHYYTRIRLWPLRSAYNKPAPTGGPKSGGAKTGVEAATTRPVPCTINHTITHPTTTCSARTSAPTPRTRQLPVTQPEVAYVFFHTRRAHPPAPPCAALRVAITLTPTLHYVDDYGAIQPSSISQSSLNKVFQ